jgi:hypothetical protein
MKIWKDCSMRHLSFFDFDINENFLLYECEESQAPI